MKWLKISAIVIPLLIIIVVAVLFWRLDAIVRSTVESQSATQLNVPVTLKSASVSLFGGKVGLKDYALGSPQGFNAPSMFRLEGVDVEVAYSQLTRQPIRVGLIDIRKPQLVLEQSNLKFNIQALMDQMPASAGGASSGDPVRLIIDKLRISDAGVTIKPGIPGLKDEYVISVPTLELSRIGTDATAENGAAIREVVLKVITALAAEAAKSEGLPPEVRQVLAGNLKGLIDEKAKAVEDQLRGAATRIADDPSKIKDVGKDLEKGLKDLIPKKK